jgi:capsular polysaccharide biosynthesis protein
MLAVTRQQYYVDPVRASNTQAALARVPAVAEDAIKVAGARNRTAGGLLGSSTVTNPADTDILRFTVTDGDQRLAARLSTAYARAFTRYRRRLDTGSIVDARNQIERRLAALESSGQTHSSIYRDLARNDLKLRTQEALQASNVSLVRPGGGAAQIQPKPMRNTVLGFILGLIMGVALAFARDALNTRVSSAEEIQERLRLPLLARIPQLPKHLRSAEGVAMLSEPAELFEAPGRRTRTDSPSDLRSASSRVRRRSLGPRCSTAGSWRPRGRRPPTPGRDASGRATTPARAR